MRISLLTLQFHKIKMNKTLKNFEFLRHPRNVLERVRKGTLISGISCFLELLVFERFLVRNVLGVCACLFLFMGNVSAAPIFGDHEFTDWSDFGGMYGKLYRDVILIDNEEICLRVLQWPQFVEDGEPVFSLDDCLGFAEEGSLTSFANTKAGTKTDLERWSELMGLKFDFEKQLWQQENSLKRQLALGTIWTDGDLGGDRTTSPFDLVVRWNEIDEILHGEKTTYPNYLALSESDDDIYADWVEDEAVDEWLNQKADNLPSPSDYPDGEESFAGGFDEQKRNFNDIASNSLIPGEAVQQTFGVPFRGSPVPTSLQMNVDAVPSIPESPDDAEQVAVQDEIPFGELQGVFGEFFEEQTALELREAEEDASRSDLFHQIFSVDPGETDKAFEEKIDLLLRDHADTRLHDGGQLELLPLLQWNIVLDTWIDNLDKWKGTTETFLTNPKQ